MIGMVLLLLGLVFFVVRLVDLVVNNLACGSDEDEDDDGRY